MQVLDEVVLLTSSLRQDRESKRWYTDGAEACVVLSECGMLLEPLPIFGASCYALIATGVQPSEAREYVLRHGYCHLRVVSQPGSQLHPTIRANRG